MNKKIIFGILGMLVIAITVFLFIPFTCAKLDMLFRFPGTITPVDFLLGTILLVIGGAVAVWCIILFLTIGKGTPIPSIPTKKVYCKRTI